MKDLDDKFGTIDDGFKALMLEKELEKIFGKKKFLGGWVREIDRCTLHVGHADCKLTVTQGAYNSCEIHYANFRVMTLEQFNEIPPGEVFSKGETVDSPDGVNLTGSGKKLRFLAKKGFGDDWTLYFHWATTAWSRIESNGDKSMNMDAIRKFVPCVDEVAQKYRS